MASEAEINGASSTASENLTAAERLREKHEAESSHHPMVEDVVDEEDIAHPPPSMHIGHESNDPPVPPTVAEPISEKAAGKQKVQNESPPTTTETKPNGTPSLNTQSEEAFPALGGGRKAMPASAPMAWGAKKPSSMHAETNGGNGTAPLSSMASSRASTPTSGIATPASTIASAPPSRGLSVPNNMSMPGRHTERIQFAPSQLLPRDQLKKPLQELLRGINQRSKARVDMKSGLNGAIVFEGTGPVDATRQALKDLAKEIGSKQYVKVPIPLSVRSHILGKQGAVIQGISKRTGARVQLPRAEDIGVLDPEDEDGLTIDVTIEGDAVAAEMGRREIERIVNERTSTVNMRLRDIPAEFYPFIAGPHNSRINKLENGRQIKIQVPHYHTWSVQPPQLPSSGMPLFTPSQSHHIRISGDRLAAQEARAEIERQVKELRQQITLAEIPIDRGRHQFVLDRGGASLHDLLEETGCAVILPPVSDDTEMLTITGPQDKIDAGMDRVMNLAMSMQMSGFDIVRDIARRHTNAPMGPEAHARALTRYLLHRKAIEQLEQQYSAHIILPNPGQGPTNWEIYSRDGTNGIRARSDVMNIIGAHPPSRIRHIEMDPFFHQHAHRQGARYVHDEFGVHILDPEEDASSPHMILVYEGPNAGGSSEYQLPKQQPSPQDIAEFERNLHRAQEHLLTLIQGQEDIGAASVEVPPKYREKVRKFVRQEQSNLPQSAIPVQVSFSSCDAIRDRPSSAQSLVNAPVADLDCSLRGPSSTVEDLAEKIVVFVETEKRDELERGHVTSFEFPEKYANHLIGKRGENLKKYQEEFDVDVRVKDGKVDIIGPKAKAEAAKSRIIALGKKMEDEATHVLKINPQYHREMIGIRGSEVNKLQNKYNVRVQFPRTATLVNDDRSVADDVSDAGSTRNRRSNQAVDEVIVRGPRKGADAAKDELLNLLQYLLDTSHTSTVSVAQAQLPSLIGHGGEEMETLRRSTGAQIDVPGSRETTDPNGRVQIQLKGTKKAVDDARKLLEQRVKVFDDSIKRSVDVDKRHHKALIGAGGSNIRNIVINAGGSDDRRDLAKTVRFPRQDLDDNIIRVEGNKVLVDNIVAAIEAFVSQRENQTTEIIEVAPENCRILIGRGGETRRALESQFNIGLDVPKLSQQGLARSQVKISGQPSDVEKAVAHIRELIRNQEGETLQVPRKYHQTISDNGQFFRQLWIHHKVNVDHGGHKPPEKSTGASQPHTNGISALPLITDDQNSIDNHHWELFDGNQSAEEGEIPWHLKGSPENVEKARTMLEKAIERASKQQSRTVGYLTLPDPKTHRFIIGQNGNQINSIRHQTGCKITIPRDPTQGSAIEIVGDKDEVVHARDIILDIVQNGGRRD